MTSLIREAHEYYVYRAVALTGEDRYAFTRYLKRELLNMIGNEQKRPYYSDNSKKQAIIA